MKRQTQKVAEEAQNLLQKFTAAESWRRQYDDKAVEWYKLYVGYREPLGEDYKGRSNLHIPRVYEEIDTLRSRFLKTFFSSRPYIDFLPMPVYGENVTPEEMMQRDMDAKVGSSLLDMQFDKNNFMKKFYDYLTSFLVFPAGVMAVGWRYETKTFKKEIEVPDITDTELGPAIAGITKQMAEFEHIVFDDNEIVNVDYFDFWPDPRGEDIDSCRYVFQREWLTKEQLEERLALLEGSGSGDVYSINFKNIEDVGEGEEGRWQRLSAVGLTPETTDLYYEQDTSKGLFEVLHYWENTRHAMLINRQIMAFDGESPYWRHGKKPFIAHSYEPLPNEFYGMSAVGIIEHLQHELNTLRNQRVDNISFVLNRMWKVKKGADIDESELVSRPHGIIHVDNVDDVTELSMSDITSSAFQDEIILKQDMENALGVPAVVRGVNPSRRETATEVVTKSSNASVKFDVKVLLFEELGLKRLAFLMDMNNRQFITEPRLVYIFGHEGAAAWGQFNPENDTGDYLYRPAGSSTDAGANKDYKRQQLNQLMSIVLPADIPFIDKYELVKAWLESYDLRNIHRFLIPKEQAEAQMQMMQQLAMLMQGGASPGSPGPPQSEGVPPPVGAPGMGPAPPLGY